MTTALKAISGKPGQGCPVDFMLTWSGDLFRQQAKCLILLEATPGIEPG
jgi:hypothetical protein